MQITGHAWTYGDDVNTDVIFPGKYTYTLTNINEFAKHALEDLDPDFAKLVKPDDVIVGGKNFGCGSSREQAAVCIKLSGVRVIVAKSFARIAEWVKLVKVFDSDSPKTALLNGDVDLGVVWSGEAAILWNQNKKFHYVIPAEGAHQFIDVLAIPTNAKNPDAAHQFINYILRPEVSRLISNAFPYTNPNAAARALLSAEELANPASYPQAGKLETFRDIGRAAADVDRLVTDLKSTH